MRGDRYIFSLPPLYFVLSPYSHPIDCTSSPPQSSPVFKIKDIATVHTGNTEGSLAGKMSTICLHCRVVMLILSLCHLRKALVLWLAGLLISVCYKCVTSYSSSDPVNNQSKSAQWKSQEKWVHCSILLVHNALVDSGFYVSVGPIHPVPKIRGGLPWVAEVFFRSRELFQTMNTVYFILRISRTDLWSQGKEDPASKIILLCPVGLSSAQQ